MERGDTVVRIAQRHGTLSSNVVTAEGQLPNPYRLFPGQVLYVRPISEPKPTTHTVVPGETLPKIAAQHKVSAQAILAVNPGVDFNLFIAGQTVHVPSDAGKLRQLPCCLALQFAEKIVALLVLQAQASQMQALQTQPLQAGHMDILNLPIRYVTTTPYWYALVRPCVCNVSRTLLLQPTPPARFKSGRLLC